MIPVIRRPDSSSTSSYLRLIQQIRHSAPASPRIKTLVMEAVLEHDAIISEPGLFRLINSLCTVSNIYPGMDYRPKYYQPFTLEEAVRMDVAVLTEEITRLQNSLQHLKRTQTELQEARSSTPDPDIVEAIKENELVIGSQEERISILKMALMEKGVFISSHYDLALAPSNATSNTQIDTSASAQDTNRSTHAGTGHQESDDGVYL